MMKRVSIIIVLFFWLVQFSNAATYYVDINGNDASGDGSSARPWRTLRFAVSKVPGNQGHTIKLSSGTFIEQGPIDIPTRVNIEGAGNSTVLKATSSFYFNPETPRYSDNKYLLRFISSSPTNGGQSIKNLTINGDGKKLHGGILLQQRDNILVEGVRFEYINFNGLWMWKSKNSRITNTEFLNCSWGSTAWCSGALMIGDLENMEIDHVKVDEGRGYGIKALGFNTNTNLKLTNLKIYESRISVHPIGLWADGKASNIALELWDVDLSNVEIYNNYLDNTLSLVMGSSNQTGKTVHAHHNFFDIAGPRAQSQGYSIELTTDNVEIDHNYFNGGQMGIAEWTRPPHHRKNWNIHHNVFYGLDGAFPSQAVRSNCPVTNVKFNNNTFESKGTKTAHVIGLFEQGTSSNIEVKNNLFINSNTGYNYGVNQFVHLANGASVQNLQVSNNLFHKLNIGNVSGSYSNNITGVDPQINASGNRPDPYYRPKAGSPLIDKGVNVGYPYSGSAPDIGAYEYGSAAPPPPANTPPSIGLSAPSNNASFAAGSSITLGANASDANGTISKVEFYNGSTKLGEDATSPYSFTWNNVQAGTYTITARATDNQGAATTSSPITVTVVAATNESPAVALTSPANGANFTGGSTVTLNATASDSDGTITKVEFYNGSTKLGEDVTGPYSFTWNSVPAGTYTITARATDNKGAVTTSSPITITGVAATNESPVVSLTSPANGASFIGGSTVTLNANATDSDGSIAKVEFYNGSTKLGEDVTTPYSFSWASVPVGSYSITARATDNRGAVSTSAVRTITIIANALPEISLTGPSNNASFAEGSSISLSATATDRDGSVTKVEFYNGSTKLGEDASGPYSFTWTNVPAGSYTITARATDDKGGVTNSAGVKVNVTGSNTLPTVKITSPANNSNHIAESSVIISVTASDNDGTITKVEFYNGTIKIGEDTSSPYSLTWNNLKEGSYNLVAKATDDKGGSSTAQVVILVETAGIAPVANAGDDVTIQLPENSFDLQGFGNDSDGVISNYSWEQVDGPNQATLTANAADGSANVSNLQEGTYRFILTVTDNGNLTSTDEVIVRVMPASIDQRVQLPKVFTPNNDGIEDTWNWSDTEPFESCKLTIYNRFGQKIYESISYDNTWDGSVNGSPLQEDAYYYVITCDNGDLTGAVRIVR